MRTKTKSEKENKRRLISDLLIWIVIFALLAALPAIPQALGYLQVSHLEQNDTLEKGSRQSIILNIDANSTIATALIEIDGQNYTMDRGSNYSYYSYSWIPDNLGINIYTIYATDEMGESIAYTRQFLLVDTISPKIIGYGPNGKINSGSFEIKAITDENSICRYDSIDMVFDSMQNWLSGNETIHSEVKFLPDGSYNYFIRCKDPSQNTGDSKLVSFSIDSTSPDISITSIQGAVTQNPYPLKVSSNEPATCRWGIAYGDYQNLSNYFQTTGGTKHEQALILNEGLNSYYISCKDLNGNALPSMPFNIDFNSPPKASISVEKGSYSALKSGIYSVVIDITEPLANPPSLKLNCPGRIINVPLQGSGAQWQGNLIIPDEEIYCAGEFVYVGEDLLGTIGNELIGEKLIIVDSRKPEAPFGLKLSKDLNKIKISWQYDRDVDHFNIYRSTTGNTDKNNLVYSTKQTTFSDSYVQNKIGYFYRVSAVGISGRESDLSEELFLMSEFDNDTVFSQDPKILEMIDLQISKLELYIGKIDDLAEKYSEGSKEYEILSGKQILAQMNDVKNTLSILIGELRTYRASKITLSDINARISIIDKKLEENKKLILVDIHILDTQETEQDLSEDALSKAVDERLLGATFTAEQKNLYVSQEKQIIGKTRIAREAAFYEMSFEDNSNQKGVIIIEKILAPADLKEVLQIQEVIPKGVMILSEIDFTQAPDDMNLLGPVWYLKNIPGGIISYSQGGDVSLDSLESIQTIPLLDENYFLSTIMQNNTPSDGLTGAVVSGGAQSGGAFMPVAMGMGSLMVIILISYLIILNNKGRGAPGGISSADTYFAIKEMLRQAKQALSSGSDEEAEQLYANARDLFSKGKFTMMRTLELNIEFNLLYEEIMLRAKRKSN
jgi:hypothetical protein